MPLAAQRLKGPRGDAKTSQALLEIVSGKLVMPSSSLNCSWEVLRNVQCWFFFNLVEIFVCYNNLKKEVPWWPAG